MSIAQFIYLIIITSCSIVSISLLVLDKLIKLESLVEKAKENSSGN